MDSFDIIGPIMIGPSSSHTAGAVRIGKYARTILGCEPRYALIRLSGSFARTHKGHGTDKALVAGILGMETDDERIRISLQVAHQRGLGYAFEETDLPGAHPNTAEIVLRGDDNVEVTVRGASVGGGNILINRINNTSVSISGRCDTLIIPHRDVPGVVADVTGILADNGVNLNGFSLCRDYKGGTAVMTIEMDGSMDERINELISSQPHVFSSTVLKAI